MNILIRVMQAYRKGIQMCVLARGWQILAQGYTGGSTEWTVVIWAEDINDLEVVRAAVEENIGWCEVSEFTEQDQVEFCGT